MRGITVLQAAPGSLALSLNEAASAAAKSASVLNPDRNAAGSVQPGVAANRGRPVLDAMTFLALWAAPVAELYSLNEAANAAAKSASVLNPHRHAAGSVQPGVAATGAAQSWTR